MLKSRPWAWNGQGIVIKNSTRVDASSVYIYDLCSANIGAQLDSPLLLQYVFTVSGLIEKSQN